MWTIWLRKVARVAMNETRVFLLNRENIPVVTEITGFLKYRSKYWPRYYI
jgi:hypothetical protein